MVKREEGPANPPGTWPSTSNELLDDLRNHKESAWTRFLQLYQPLIFKWCRDLGLQTADCEEVLSHVVEALWLGIGDFQYGRFRAYLRTITRYKAIDLLRRKGRELQKHLPAAVADDVAQRGGFPSWCHWTTVSAEEYFAETQLLMAQAAEIICKEFPSHYWSVVRALVTENERVEEVAKQHDLQPNTVYKIRKRVLGYLRSEFEALILGECDGA